MVTKVPIWVPILAAGAGLVAILNYIEGKTHRETQRRIAIIDEEIKKHQLEALRKSINK